MSKPRPKPKVEETKTEKKDAPSADATPDAGTPMEEVEPEATVEEVIDDAPASMEVDDVD